MRPIDETFKWDILITHFKERILWEMSKRNLMTKFKERFDKTFHWDILIRLFIETFKRDILMRHFEKIFW